MELLESSSKNKQNINSYFSFCIKIDLLSRNNPI